MRYPAFFSATLALSLPFLAAACDGRTDTGPGGTGGSSGSSGAGGLDNYHPAACTATPVDQSASCPAPCPVRVNVEVACDDDYLGFYGVHVVPAPDATWLSTSSSEDRMLYQLDAKGGVRKDDALPKIGYRQIPLSLTPEGAMRGVMFTGIPGEQTGNVAY